MEVTIKYFFNVIENSRHVIELLGVSGHGSEKKDSDKVLGIKTCI